MSSGHLKKLETVSPAQIEWRNGLPYSTEFKDVYFSIHGAVEESQHVFIEGNCLLQDWSDFSQERFSQDRLPQSDSAQIQPSQTQPSQTGPSQEHLCQNDFKLVELGFGSGLNFLNTAHHWQQFLESKKSTKTFKHLHYIAVEKRPFSIDDFSQACACWPEFKTISNKLIDSYPSTTYGRHQICFNHLNLTLTLFYMPVEDALQDLICESYAQETKTKIDHWFLDGFSPTKNASMWNQENADNIAKLSKNNTRLASYSVAASVKQPLANAGFIIKKQSGFAKKREMLTAVFSVQKFNTNNNKLINKFINIKYESPWFNIGRSDSISIGEKNSVAIIGAGIAGCMTAYALDAKGISCDIFDSNNGLAKGASGAAAGIFHPQLTLDMNYGSQFSWLAYLRLIRFLSDLSPNEKAKIILKQGLYRFLEEDSQQLKIIALSKQLNLDQWLQLVKLNNKTMAIYFPDAAALNIPALCHYLYSKIGGNGTKFISNSLIDSVDFKDQKWCLSVNHQTKEYTHVINCVGARSHLLAQLKIENTNTTRGQSCFFESKPLAQKLDRILSEQIYLVPGCNHQFHLGATFDDLGSADKSIKPNNLEQGSLSASSQTSLLQSAAKFLSKHQYPFLTSEQIKSTPLAGNLGYRLHSHDRLPQVGGHLDHAKLSKDFSQIGQKRLNRHDLGSYNLPGLWINTGYGSHGLLHSLLASEHLASQITNDISPISQALSNTLNPTRFLIRKLKKRV